MSWVWADTLEYLWRKRMSQRGAIGRVIREGETLQKSDVPNEARWRRM